MMATRKWNLLLLALVLCAGFPHTLPAQQSRQFNILFDDHCDGMNLFLSSGGLAVGVHTGCNAGELVAGSQFSSGDESGVSVTFFERASGLLVRCDIYRTGFRAGRFYVYLVRNNQLLRSSTYRLAP